MHYVEITTFFFVFSAVNVVTFQAFISPSVNVQFWVAGAGAPPVVVRFHAHRIRLDADHVGCDITYDARVSRFPQSSKLVCNRMVCLFF